MEYGKPSLSSGLDAILKLRDRTQNIKSNVTLSHEQFCSIRTDKLIPGEFQPRKLFSSKELEELAASIQSQGILQPIIVRRRREDFFEIIAGERRWRAAQLVGLTSVPVIIKEISDSVAAAFSLVENIQRKDLNPLEEANALHRLYHEFNLSHEQIAFSIGRSRVAVTNMMRLLSLHEKVKHYLLEDVLTMGHARALISLAHNEQEYLCDIIVKKALSVRQTERLVKEWLSTKSLVVDSEDQSVDPELVQWQKQLADYFQCDFTIKEVSSGQYHIVMKINSKQMLAEWIERIRH